jgi:outer membrane lipoprotein-sorting protein
LFAGPPAWAADGPEKILEKSDAIRNPQSDYTLLIKVTSHKPNRPPQVAEFKAYVKGREKSVVVSQAPAMDRGRILLMNGKNCWGYLPNVSKPLRISLQDRLVGEVANGDIARSNFSGDYDVVGITPSTLSSRKASVLELKAKTEDVTYGRILLTVEDVSYRPVMAEFYGFSGRLLKTCRYEDYKNLGGAVRPTRLVMTDAVAPDRWSDMQMSNMQIKELPERYFSKDYMKKFAAE